VINLINAIKEIQRLRYLKVINLITTIGGQMGTPGNTRCGIRRLECVAFPVEMVIPAMKPIAR
jgi:hypothetical protein